MTYNKIYKILSSEKTKLITIELLYPHKINVIIITSSVKQCGAQMYNA